jgi:hypothetical protein
MIERIGGDATIFRAGAVPARRDALELAETFWERDQAARDAAP